MQDPYYEDDFDGESQPPYSRQYYVLMSVIAVLTVIGSIAYGGYRIFQDAQEAKNAVNYSPNYFTIGQQLAEEEQFAAAAELFQGLVDEPGVLRTRRARATVKSWLACCRNALGEHQEAERLFREVHRQGYVDLNGSVNNRFFLACSLASQGEDDEAIQALSEYLLLGGEYPRPEHTFKVAAQLQHLEDSGRVRELLNLPQMDFEFLYGRRSAISGNSNYELGSTFANVDLQMESMSLKFRINPNVRQEFDSWQMVCYLDVEEDVWRARLVTGSSAIGEFSGDLEKDRLHMTGTWIPATGGVTSPAKLEFTRDPTNAQRTRVRILRSVDGSSDWSRAQKICDMSLLRN